MAKIGLLIRPGTDAAAELGRQVVSWGAQRGYAVLPESASSELLGAMSDGRKLIGVSLEELIAICDIVVTLGGDGTLIGAARLSVGGKPTFVGVNFGNLGFLTEVLPAELLSTLDETLAGRAIFVERHLLMVEVSRAGQTIFSSQAVNDAVIHKGTRDKLLELDFAVDGEAVMRARCDGLILATPTGSTAYSLAAGGSIVHPSLPVVLVTPLCPHSLTVRPLIVSIDSLLTVSIPPYEGEVLLAVDGQVNVTLGSGDRVRVTRSPNSARFVRSKTRRYFDVLRTKLHWALGNKPG